MKVQNNITDVIYTEKIIENHNTKMTSKPAALNEHHIDPDILLNEKQAAQLLGLSPRFMQMRRYRGDGPRFVRVSKRCVRYRRKDLTEWSEVLLRTSTSDRGDAGDQYCPSAPAGE